MAYYVFLDMLSPQIKGSASRFGMIKKLLLLIV